MSDHKSVLSYFTGSFIFTFIGLVGCGFIGHYYEPTMAGLAQAVFIASVLAILEVSLSFDNAIVNAVILEQMTPKWRHRFLTWGILIAVFGMRLVFPLAIVSFMASINPWEALVMAATQPQLYAEKMMAAHLEVAAFGGSFLLLVCLKYFYDENKEHHWISWLEKPFVSLGRIDAIEVGVALIVILTLTYLLPDTEQIRFILAGIFGILTYIAVDGLGSWLEYSGQQKKDIHRASAGMFIYLEVLDASFSFDGVIGAFAVTQNLFIIMIGLSIGAFFVRSLTLLFVEKKTLNQFAYLEHGAFYAIGALAMMMLLDPFFHIPEWVVGLLGAAIILVAFLWSLRTEAPTSQPKLSSPE